MAIEDNYGKDQYYIVRGDRSGVFFGNIKERDGREVTIANCRCIHYWEGAASLLQMMRDGVARPEDCRFTVTVSELAILDAIEILPCTEKARDCILGVTEWKIVG